MNQILVICLLDNKFQKVTQKTFDGPSRKLDEKKKKEKKL